MTKTTLKHLLCCMMAVLILFQISARPVSACAEGQRTDSSTGWSFSLPSTYIHTGQKNLTYYYGTLYSEDYHTHFVNGKNMWGSSISLTRTSDASAANVIYGMEARFPEKVAKAYAVTKPDVGVTPGLHHTRWNLILHQAKFDPSTAYQKKVTTAHEIGHVYGLGHVDAVSQIMYGSDALDSMAVTAKDTRGIHLMTHEHTCLWTSRNNTYAWIDGSRHRKRCNTCLSFIYETHTNGAACTLCG